MWVLADARWAALAPLVEECRPRGETGHRNLRRTGEAIVWRHRNGAAWRSIPAELGPWWAAAQTFIRRARLGTWERLLGRAQARGIELGSSWLPFSGSGSPASPASASTPPFIGRLRRAGPVLSGGPGPRARACLSAAGDGLPHQDQRSSGWSGRPRGAHGISRSHQTGSRGSRLLQICSDQPGARTGPHAFSNASVEWMT